MDRMRSHGFHPVRSCATTAQQGGADVDTDLMLPCSTRDEGWPLGLGVQARGPNRRLLRGPNGPGGERAGHSEINSLGGC